MKLLDPELQRLLAGRYVIGTLRGPARKRFELYLRMHPGLRQAVGRWEEQLQPLADALPPEPTHPRVYEGIRTRLWGADRSAQKVEPRSRPGWLNALAFAAVAAIAVVIGWQLNETEVAPPPLHLAILNDATGSGGYLLCSDVRTGRTAIEVMRSRDEAAEGSHELWLLPADGGNPRSVALMPTSGRKVIDFPSELAPLLATAKGLAVSREPSGGAPDGVPTGPIVYTGAVINMWIPKPTATVAASPPEPDPLTGTGTGTGIAGSDRRADPRGALAHHARRAQELVALLQR